MSVPFVRLSGKWLEQAGFLEDGRVEVIVSKGEIRLVCLGASDKPRPPQGELFDSR